MVYQMCSFVFCAVSTKDAQVATQYGNQVCCITVCVFMFFVFTLNGFVN